MYSTKHNVLCLRNLLMLILQVLFRAFTKVKHVVQTMFNLDFLKLAVLFTLLAIPLFYF